MQRSIMLALRPKQMSYHRLPNVKLIQRKEDKNTIIQGEHCIIVLEEMETFLWDQLNGENTVSKLVDSVMSLEDYRLNPRTDIEDVIIPFIEDLKEKELIELL